MNERRIRRHDAGGPLLLAGLAAVCLFLPLGRLRAASQRQSAPTASATKILVDYPLDGSVFPPEITPPTFLFRDTSATAKRWVVEIHLRNPQQVIRIDAAGEHYRPGEIDTAVGTADEVLKLTSELSATRTWRPDTDTWAKIKSGSVRSPATVVIMGFDGESAGQPVSSRESILDAWFCQRSNATSFRFRRFNCPVRIFKASAVSKAATACTMGAMIPAVSHVGELPGAGISGSTQRRHGVRRGTIVMPIP